MSKEIKFTFILVFTMLLGIQSLNAKIVPRKIESYGISYRLLDLINKNVAVLPFRNTSGTTQVTDSITDAFSIYLVKSNLFNVIERSRLKELFNEQDKYGLTNRIDENSAAKAGRILGADAVFVGNIYEYNTYNPGFFIFASPPAVRIGVRLILTETGETIWSAEDEFNGFDKTVQKLVAYNDRWRIRTDVDFLAKILSRELVKTLLDTYKKQLTLEKINYSSAAEEKPGAKPAAVKKYAPSKEIYFENGSDLLSAPSITQINEAIAQIKQKHPSKIVIEGYSDFNEKTDVTPLNLSKKRAEAVKKYLMKKIANVPVITIGYGTAYSNKSDLVVEKQKNRRVEIIMLFGE